MAPLLDILKKIILAIIILIVVLVAVFVLILGYFSLTASDNSQSVYIYELKLSTTGPLEDATLLIPIPSYYNAESGKNETVVDISRVSFTNFDRENISVQIEEINGVPMLKISADRIIPLYKNRITPIPIMPGQDESELPQPTHIYSDRYSEETPLLVEMETHMYDTSAGHEIDTKSPVGNEPLFMPYRIADTISSPDSAMYGDYYVSAGSSGYVFETPFILSYTAGDENVLAISSEFQGINQWWVGGWQSNSYHERIRHEFRGECNGTYPVEGVLITGEGVY